MTTQKQAEPAPQAEPVEEQNNGGNVAKSPLVPKTTMGWSSKGGLQVRTLDEAYRFAAMIHASGWAPMVGARQDRRPMNTNEIFAAIQLGAEVGLPPMQAVQNIAVINGRPTIWGDAMPAICRMSGQFDDDGFQEFFEGEPFADDFTAVCKSKRIGSKTVYEGRFSVADAKKADLWGKPGPWQQYPRRMLQMRARAFSLRDGFNDVLCGLHAREEITADQALEGIDLSKLEDPPYEESAAAEHQPASRAEQVASQLKARKEQAVPPPENRAEPEPPKAPPKAEAKQQGPTKAELVEKVDELVRECSGLGIDLTGVRVKLMVNNLLTETIEGMKVDQLKKAIGYLEEKLEKRRAKEAEAGRGDAEPAGDGNGGDGDSER